MAHLLPSQALKQDSFTPSFFATHLQAKILRNMACKCQKFRSRMLKSYPLVHHLHTSSIPPHTQLYLCSLRNEMPKITAPEHNQRAKVFPLWYAGGLSHKAIKGTC